MVCYNDKISIQLSLSDTCGNVRRSQQLNFLEQIGYRQPIRLDDDLCWRNNLKWSKPVKSLQFTNTVFSFFLSSCIFLKHARHFLHRVNRRLTPGQVVDPQAGPLNRRHNMSIDELRVIKVTHVCVLAFPHNTHTANSWYDLFIPSSSTTFIILSLACSLGLFIILFWAVTQSGTYDNNTWYASLKSHIDQLWYRGCEVAVRPTPTQCFETRQALQLYLRLPSIKQNYVEMEFFFFFIFAV